MPFVWHWQKFKIMQYNTNNVRRQDRLLNEPEATSLLQTGEYGVLSMQAGNEGGYGIPINYAWDGQHAIYLHCALEGHKLNSIAECNKVSFCVVGKTNVISNKFTTGYESIILKCTAHIGLSTKERMKALELILEKYSPNDKETGMKYAKKSFDQTEIIRLKIIEWSGKTKVVV
jgi:nitroimidazol reductase NimA-like FMN-containing flavoprotein (pyridoxamine 5'-phosphate oxidase superfamily)